MSNLGFHNLFNRISSYHGFRAVRFFLERGNRLYSPDKENPRKAELFSHGGTSLKGFDAVFFSVSFELDYINLIRMLMISSIPPLCDERHSETRRPGPVIITGGIAVTANPEVISAFSDIVFIGDMEENLEKILNILVNKIFITGGAIPGGTHKNNVFMSDKLFRELSAVDGVYIAGKTVKTVALKRSIYKEITLPAHSVVLTGGTEFSNMFLVEIVRGCKGTCLFCATRCATGPVRQVRKKAILSIIDKARPESGRVGLIGPVLTDNDDLVEIVDALNDMGFSAAFSSLRADEYSDVVAGLLVKNRQNTVTFAPETGSYRLRKKIGKNLTDEDLLDAVSLSIEHGIKNIRFYIMYGLPGEEIEDIKATADLVKRTAGLLKKPGCTLHLSINPFVPKKGTPFEDRKVCTENYYANMKEILTDELKRTDRVSLKYAHMRSFYTHALLSLGTRETGIKLYDALIKKSVKSFKRYAKEALFA
jgi:radical SAM superfamily enzyme YgiQ (UPF0313 family)